jgi:pyrroline-5-carboxylate reductase
MSMSVVLAGAGNMGYAMLESWLKSGLLAASETFVVEPNAELCARAAQLGAAAVDTVERLPAGLDPILVVFAVKPQVIRDVVKGYRHFAKGRTAFLSVAAGTRIAAFEEILGAQAPIVRCMPNTPAAIGKGMMVTVKNAHVTDETMAFVDGLLKASGEVAEVESEGLMDAVTAVSGSGPAYIFHFIECLTAAAKSVGLPEETAKLLAMQTVYGAATLAAKSTETPARLREQVTSPNGTTAAALSVLMGEDRLKTLVTEAVEAARKRSVELGK